MSEVSAPGLSTEQRFRCAGKARQGEESMEKVLRPKAESSMGLPKLISKLAD